MFSFCCTIFKYWACYRSLDSRLGGQQVPPRTNETLRCVQIKNFLFLQQNKLILEPSKFTYAKGAKVCVSTKHPNRRRREVPFLTRSVPTCFHCGVSEHQKFSCWASKMSTFAPPSLNSTKIIKIKQASKTPKSSLSGF